MARARTIKPGFFTHGELGECQPLARLLFQGLWCLADRDGRLKDRPREIKVQILPYDDCDVSALLWELSEHGFIVRYTVDGIDVVQVCNFVKHQNPHPREADSELPQWPHNGGILRSREITRLVPENSEQAGPSIPLPSPLNPIPAHPSGEAREEQPTKAKKRGKPKTSLSDFLEPTGGLPPAEWGDYPRDTYGWDGERINATWRAFKRYWSSPDCKHPLKADWRGTWENWVDRDSVSRPGGGTGGPAGGGLAAALRASVANRCGAGAGGDGLGGISAGAEAGAEPVVQRDANGRRIIPF